MTICSGNHYIIAFYISTDQLVSSWVHEKDESGRDNYGTSNMNTACIVNRDLKILDTGLSHTIMDSQSFKDVDDASVFCINNIIVEYYQALHKKDRDKDDLFIIDVFTAYIEFTLNTAINGFELDENENKFIDIGIVHWVFTVPDDWNDKYFDTFKSHLMSTNVRSIDSLILVRKSDALIRHLQIAHYNHSFVNGDYCIVIYFSEDNKVDLYGYEIGPPIKGLNNVAGHTRTELESIPVDYQLDKYLLNTVFNGDKSELEEYNITLESLTELCKKKYWDDYHWSFYKVISSHKTTHLRNVKDSFLLEKGDVLKSIKLRVLVRNMEMYTANYTAITKKVAEISRKHNNVRAIVVNDLSIRDRVIELFIDLLPSNLEPKYHAFWLIESKIFTSGAVQIVQSQLKIDNHLPQSRNIDAFEVISKENIMYIDINWNDSSVLYIDSKKKETFIENISDAVRDCYSLEDCFQVIHHEHQFHLSSITINDKYKKMLNLDKQQSAQKSPHSRKKKNSNPNKAVGPFNANSVSELSMKLQLRDIFNAHVKNKSQIHRYKMHIPKDQQQELLIMYIKCVQVHIIQHLLSRGALKKNDSFTTYFSIDRSILNTFLIDYEKVKTIFNESNTTHIWSHSMKLIQREQLSAVHCKDTIKCFENVEDYLDYPQHIMQVQLYPSYIDLTLNAVLALNKNIKLANNETVLILKRKRIPFNIVDVMSELLWDHIQTRKASLISICHKHTYLDYDEVSMYIDFISHFIYWFTHEYTVINNKGKSEWNKEIPMKMNAQCDCTLSITPMDLFDICIIPAIQQVMFMVYGGTTNTHIFGDTKIQHIILMGSIMNIKCNTTHKKALYLLKECIKKQNKYYNHILVHWTEQHVSKMVNQGIKSIKINPSGGLLEQIISGRYGVIFDKAVYLDFQKSDILDAGNYSIIIDYNTVVTEDMRETGRFSSHYYEGENIYLGKTKI
ncbi:hypothetical protein BDB01DRAFT_902724 [Pilobolus umbonatus]|nr:hypothetical protein BDB01DRAFT_902724 [Pilobolus umbonatus]